MNRPGFLYRSVRSRKGRQGRGGEAITGNVALLGRKNGGEREPCETGAPSTNFLACRLSEP